MRERKEKRVISKGQKNGMRIRIRGRNRYNSGRKTKGGEMIVEPFPEQEGVRQHTTEEKDVGIGLFPAMAQY